MSEKQNLSNEAARTAAEEHFERGRKLWKEGKRAEAMSEYNRAVALDAESPASVALDMAQKIMDFYDKQRYNP